MDYRIKSGEEEVSDFQYQKVLISIIRKYKMLI